MKKIFIFSSCHGDLSFFNLRFLHVFKNKRMAVKGAVFTYRLNVLLNTGVFCEYMAGRSFALNAI